MFRYLWCYDIEQYHELMHALFLLEDRFGIEPCVDGSGFSVLCGKLPSQPWDGAGGHGESSCIEARPAIGYAYGVGGEKFDNRKEGREG